MIDPPFLPMKTLPEGKQQPLVYEVYVNPQYASCCLVSTSRSLMWVPIQPSGESARIVRTAFRVLDTSLREGLVTLSEEVIREIALVGERSKWGTVFPATVDSLTDAIYHLDEHAYHAKEILVSAHYLKSVMSTHPFLEGVGKINSFKGASLRIASWVPEGWACVLPLARQGMFYGTDSGSVGMVLVDVSRSICILKP